MIFLYNMQIPKIAIDSINSVIPQIKSKPFAGIMADSASRISDLIAPVYPFKSGQAVPLKVFEGMTKKEIDFLLDDLHVISLGRGCSHRCTHCFASAVPAGKDHDNYISKMPFEDYENLMVAFHDLKQHGFPIKNSQFNTTMFHDSDCMELTLRDKSGQEHDFIDLHKIFYKSTGIKTVFDTAGWNPRSQRLQERAERYVEYLSENNGSFTQINLSINPFNIMYQKALDLGYNPAQYSVVRLNEAPKSLGEKAYRLYIDQMANMLYTFTPMRLKSNFGVIIRVADDSAKNMAPFNAKSFKQIRSHILGRLYQLYMNDLHSERRFAKSTEQVINLIEDYMELLGKYDTKLLPTGRYGELYKKRNPGVTEKDLVKLYPNYERSNFNLIKLKYDYSNDFVSDNYMKFIDTDGRVYLYDSFHFIPTELQLKLSTNGKEVPKLGPHVVDDFIITREMINKM